jgi:hypothetical protein
VSPILGSAELPLAPLIVAFHVVSADWFLSAAQCVLETFGSRGRHVLGLYIEGEGAHSSPPHLTSPLSLLVSKARE